MPLRFPELTHPIVQAPLAGGPSTPELAAAISDAGGLGNLAAGYLTADALRDEIVRVRELTSAPFGVNIFCLAESRVDADRLNAYARRLQAEARRHGVELGAPRFEDDAYDAKLELMLDTRPAVVSFTFGCPSAEDVQRLHDAGIAVWVTVTEPEEGRIAAAAGADALIAQGVEAGGHRASFSDVDGSGELGVLPLLRLLAHAGTLPLVAAGGIADGAGIAAVLAAGARAAQIGTAFMRSPEAGTSAPHREALSGSAATALTRAFTGRRARGIVNRFLSEHSAEAPTAYPHVHHLTSPVRRAARAAGEADAINLWAGEAYELAPEAPAGELVLRWSEEARLALGQAGHVLASGSR